MDQRQPRKDETQHLRILPPEDRAPRPAEDILRDVSQIIRNALQARAALVSELGEGVEYEAQLARERIAKAGVNADLSAIRIGEYFKRMTEFNLLQRVHRAIESRMEGQPSADVLNPDGDEG
jgi:hypothetical protein